MSMNRGSIISIFLIMLIIGIALIPSGCIYRIKTGEGAVWIVPDGQPIVVNG